MTKYLKYLFSLFLAFGLIVNDGILDSRSNAAPYDQVSYFTIRKDFKNSKSYRFNQRTSSEKTLPPIPLAQLQLQDIYSLHIKVQLKLQIVLYQDISAIKAQHVFLSKISTSSNPYSSLHIA
ncbi:hypothetical protein [Flavobacterium sp. Arc2]|uniref:hypothetical protein n=1 Tax=Flavobacterium sp. Arc2 TaxID=3046685 RepID=UPI00352F97ED